MDTNVHIENSDVLQAMKKARWTDISVGLGDTFRMSFKTNRKIDTAVWNKLGEQQCCKNVPKTNTTIQDNQLTKIGLGWNAKELIEAGYADTVKGKEITKGK